MKRLTFLLSLVCILVIFTNDGTVFASPPNTAPYFEENSRRVGYKTVKEAVKEFEEKCNCTVSLPTMLPDIPITHEFGAFYEKNKLLEIRFVNRKMKGNILKIEIRAVKVNFEGKEYTLQDGTKGIYIENSIFNILVVEKNNLQYSIAIGKKAPNIETPKTLIDIANSIE